MREKQELLRKQFSQLIESYETLRFKVWVEVTQDKKRQLDRSEGAGPIAKIKPNGRKCSIAPFFQP